MRRSMIFRCFTGEYESEVLWEAPMTSFINEDN